MKTLVQWSVSFLLVATALAQQQTYDAGFEPKPPSPFPPEFVDYQILPNTFSRDHRYAFLYPKRSRLYELSESRLYVAALEPFHVVSEIPIGNRSLAWNAHGYYVAKWRKDGSVAIFIVGAKWGPDTVWVIKLQHGIVAKRTDLTAVVRQEVLPDYKRSHSQPYNDYYDFIFDSEDRQTVLDSEPVAERGWHFDEAGHIMIDCTCTTDPKPFDPQRWMVRFQGVWDIARERFIETSITRIPPEPNQSLEPTAGRRDAQI